jgi:hypothetical protein
MCQDRPGRINKTNPRAEVAFITGRLAALRSLMARAEESLAAIAREQAAQGEALRGVQAELRRGVSLNREQVNVIAEVISQQQNDHLTDALLNRLQALSLDLGRVRQIAGDFLQRVGHGDVPPDQLAATFKSVAERFLSLEEAQGKPSQVDVDAVLRHLLDYEKIVVLMEGTNLYGDRIYCYLQITLRNLGRLRETHNRGKDFDPRHFGTVLESGLGEPSDEVRERMSRTYKVARTPNIQDFEERAPPKTEAAAGEDKAFDPHDYIHPMEFNYVVCRNPVLDGGLSSLTVNLLAIDEARLRLRETITRLVIDETMHPRFAKVIFTAMDIFPRAQASRPTST